MAAVLRRRWLVGFAGVVCLLSIFVGYVFVLGQVAHSLPGTYTTATISGVTPTSIPGALRLSPTSQSTRKPALRTMVAFMNQGKLSYFGVDDEDPLEPRPLVVELEDKEVDRFRISP